MELPLSELLILVSGVFGAFSITYYARSRFGNSEINTKLKNKYLEYIGTLEEEVKQYKRKARTEKARQEKNSLSLTEYDESNPMGAVKDLILGLEPLLPNAVKPFLHNPALLNHAEDIIKKNPDVIKEVLAKFVKGGKGEKTKTTESAEVRDLDSLSV